MVAGKCRLGRRIFVPVNDFFPDLQQQLDKLTVIHYDHIQENDARSDEELRPGRYSHKRGKVSNLYQRVR